ncbi:cyclic nucleotide-binding domain-containing protein 1-like [Symsagittifera roscoffensis]|uniref:cyclic nucleotide-binding domain-containing protein 1-like n=1 Tax=Symsagittifera roscoffensis TaxID=84072 RepID=UPI00307B2AA7
MASTDSLQLPIVPLGNKPITRHQGMVRSRTSPMVSLSLNYDTLQEIVQLKQMKESGAVLPDLLRERFFSTYSKLFRTEDEGQRSEDVNNISSTERGVVRTTRSADPLTSKTMMPLAQTNNRLVQLAKPKQNHQKSFSPQERGDSIVPHLGDVSYHMAQVHDVRTSATFQQKFNMALKDLRQLLQILPFERTTEENSRIAEALVDMKSGVLKEIPQNRLSKRQLLRRVACIATLDTYKEEDMTVFGNQGLFMVLRGSLSPLTLPSIRRQRDKEGGEDTLFRQPTPLLKDPREFTIGVGECFGTLYSLPDRSVNSRVLSAMTCQPGVELLKISSSAFENLIKKMNAADHMEKLSLLRKCEQYSQWPQMSLEEIAHVLEWVTFPKDEMLVEENRVAPFIGIVASGTCKAYRTIDTMHKLITGKRERRVKRMLIGELGEGLSMGEISVIEDMNSTCSIHTATPVLMAIITPRKLRDLNPVTVSLIQQSNKPTFGHVDSEWLKDEYIRSESEREWRQFKRQIVTSSIREAQIHPGTGKWTTPKSQTEEARIIGKQRENNGDN